MSNCECPKKMTLPLHMSLKVKKSVRFNQTVHIAPYERIDTEDSKNIWYSNVEIAAMKAIGKKMAGCYRKLVDQQIKGDMCYRGFEGYTVLRQRQRLLSNRCALYAHKQGMNADVTAFMYKQANQWSTNVAFVQAVHDYVDTFENPSAAKNDFTMMKTLPSVSMMVPPPDHPFAVQGFIALQSQRKSKLERKLKRRSATSAVRRVRQRVC